MTEASAENDQRESPETDVPTDVEAAAEAATAAPAAPRKPFRLRKGTRIEHGFRRGVVRDVRGGSKKKPYDVMIAWDGEKYPVWVIYSSLERDYESEVLNVL